MGTDLLPLSKADIERLANKEQLTLKQRELAEIVAERRAKVTTAAEADELRRELQLLIKAFQAKRIEAKECQAEERRFEILIGELLGPPPGQGARTDLSSDEKSDLHDQQKNDFRRMAEMKDVVEEEIAKGTTDRKPIVRTIKQVEELKAREKAKAQLPEHAFYTCSCIELIAEVGVQEVDVVITDPPYSREDLPAYSELSAFAAHALKDGGLCVTLAGQSYLPEVLRRLAEHLTYHWLGAYLMPGGQSSGNRQRGVNAFWKPICIFSKGEFQGSFGDVVRSEVNDNDAGWLHEWGQSESGILDLVRRFSKPVDLVADPFLGSGTIAAMALFNGRRMVGCDIGERWVQETMQRIGSNVPV